MDGNRPAEVGRLPLGALGLRTGMALQTRRLAEGASKREAQFFGAIEGKGVMLGPLGPQGEQTGLSVGDICVVRGFTGQYEYSFLAKVLQTFDKPFVYDLLAYPAQVDARLVRQSMRTPCSWPATLATPGPNGIADSHAVSLVDLSVSGAMIRAASQVAAMGAEVRLTLSVQHDQERRVLDLNARVCHNNRARGEDAYFIGLVFNALTPDDKLVLADLT